MSIYQANGFPRQCSTDYHRPTLPKPTLHSANKLMQLKINEQNIETHK